MGKKELILAQIKPLAFPFFNWKAGTQPLCYNNTLVPLDLKLIP